MVFRIHKSTRRQPMHQSFISRLCLATCCLLAFVTGVTSQNLSSEAGSPTFVANIANEERPRVERNESERIATLEEELRIQSAQLKELRAMIEEQQKLIQALAEHSPSNTTNGNTVHSTAESAEAATPQQTQKVEDRLKQVEDRVTM